MKSKPRLNRIDLKKGVQSNAFTKSRQLSQLVREAKARSQSKSKNSLKIPENTLKRNLGKQASTTKVSHSNAKEKERTAKKSQKRKKTGKLQLRDPKHSASNVKTTSVNNSPKSSMKIRKKTLAGIFDSNRESFTANHSTKRFLNLSSKRKNRDSSTHTHNSEYQLSNTLSMVVSNKPKKSSALLLHQKYRKEADQIGLSSFSERMKASTLKARLEKRLNQKYDSAIEINELSNKKKSSSLNREDLSIFEKLMRRCNDSLKDKTTVNGLEGRVTSEMGPTSFEFKFSTQANKTGSKLKLPIEMNFGHKKGGKRLMKGMIHFSDRLNMRSSLPTTSNDLIFRAENKTFLRSNRREYDPKDSEEADLMEPKRCTKKLFISDEFELVHDDLETQKDIKRSLNQIPQNEPNFENNGTSKPCLKIDYKIQEPLDDQSTGEFKIIKSQVSNQLKPYVTSMNSERRRRYEQGEKIVMNLNDMKISIRKPIRKTTNASNKKERDWRGSNILEPTKDYKAMKNGDRRRYKTAKEERKVGKGETHNLKKYKNKLSQGEMREQRAEGSTPLHLDEQNRGSELINYKSAVDLEPENYRRRVKLSSNLKLMRDSSGVVGKPGGRYKTELTLGIFKPSNKVTLKNKQIREKKIQESLKNNFKKGFENRASMARLSDRRQLELGESLSEEDVEAELDAVGGEDGDGEEGIGGGVAEERSLERAETSYGRVELILPQQKFLKNILEKSRKVSEKNYQTGQSSSFLPSKSLLFAFFRFFADFDFLSKPTPKSIFQGPIGWLCS